MTNDVMLGSVVAYASCVVWIYCSCRSYVKFGDTH